MEGRESSLKKLGEQNDLLASLAEISRAAAIAAGPWVITVIALAAINTLASQHVDPEVIEGFRLLVIYAFAISLVAASAIVIVASRMLGDAIYVRKVAQVRPLFAATLLLSGLASGVSALVGYVCFSALPGPLIVAGASLSAMAGLIWTALAFCSAVRDYRGIASAFLLGLCFAVLGVVWAVRSGFQATVMVWAFNAGLTIVFAALASRVLATFPQPVDDIAGAFRALCRRLLRLWQLALGGLIAAAAVWVDKWVVWAGPTGVMHSTGLIHAPLYDGAMFIACLALIPALSLFVMHIETTFFDQYRSYYEAIHNHATLKQIEDKGLALAQTAMRTLAHIVLVQAALCMMIVLGAPTIVEAAGLQFQQVGILRIGALGALFQFLFFSATSLLLFFGRHKQFLLLQVLFFILHAGLTLLTVHLGTPYYGLGNLIASVVCGLAALAVLEHTMRHLTYITFIIGNSTRASVVDAEFAV